MEGRKEEGYELKKKKKEKDTRIIGPSLFQMVQSETKWLNLST